MTAAEGRAAEDELRRSLGEDPREESVFEILDRLLGYMVLEPEPEPAR